MRLNEILGLPSGALLDEAVELTHEGSGLTVRMRTNDQRVLGERVLPPDDDCDALARAVAVVLSSWITDIHPEFSVAPPTWIAAPEPPAPPPEPEAPAAPRMSGVVRSAGTLRPALSYSFRYALALGAVVGLGGGGVRPAGALSVTILPKGAALGFGARAGASSAGSVAVRNGRAEYFRFPLGAGGVLRLEPEPVFLEAELGAALAWLHVEGRGFTPNHAHDDLTYALYAAMRLGVPSGWLEPFVELELTGFPERAVVVVDDPAGGRALPRADLRALAGAAIRP
jgi:hypothetical protein